MYTLNEFIPPMPSQFKLTSSQLAEATNLNLKFLFAASMQLATIALFT